MSAETQALPDRLVDFVERDASHLTDPLTVAAECAKRVAHSSDANNPRDVAVAVNALMPASSTPFERGLAVGMVVTLRVAGVGHKS